METMDKGLTVPKWVLINWPKISQMAQNLSAQIVCPSPKVWDFDKKRAALGVRSPWFWVSYNTETTTCNYPIVYTCAAWSPQFKNSLNIIIKAHCAIMLA